MRNTHYKQSSYGKHTTDEALQVLDSLEADGESAQYVADMIEEIVTIMKSLGAKQFGPDMAKELLASSIATGRFIPEIH